MFLMTSQISSVSVRIVTTLMKQPSASPGTTIAMNMNTSYIINNLNNQDILRSINNRNSYI